MFSGLVNFDWFGSRFVVRRPVWPFDSKVISWDGATAQVGHAVLILIFEEPSVSTPSRPRNDVPDTVSLACSKLQY